MSRKPVKKRKKTNNPTDRVIKVIIISVIAISVFAICYYLLIHSKKESSTFDKTKFTVRGVDISHHNPIIDWNEVHEQNIGFVYMKATGGISHLDRNYIYNYKAAKDKGIKAGSYHFYLFAASGEEQARHFIRTAKCESGDLYPAIDVEHSPDNPYSQDTAYISIVINELKVLENELYEYYGVHPLIYTNRDCHKLYINNNFPDNMIWMCDLDIEPSDIDNWIIWQFSHKGELPGVAGNIDLNYFRYTYDQLPKILIP